MKSINFKLSAETMAALSHFSSMPLVQAAIEIQSAQVKIMVVSNIWMPVIEGWTATLYECATHQINFANSSFIAAHLSVIYDKLAAGGTPDDIESYLQSLKEIYL